MFFLTEIDPRAAVKGSRDPLGYQPIWTSFGRELIGNLTTVTTALRNFTVLILGLHFADRVIQLGKAGEEQRADLFLKFEQLAAYSRVAKLGDEDPDRILGIRRIQRRFNEQEKLRISVHRDAQLLSNQKTYGIWGLYSVAATESGYCEDQRLTGDALDAVETEYLPRLVKGAGKDGAAILRFLASEAIFEPKGRDAALAGALAGVLGPKLSAWERKFYADTLVLRTRGGSDRTRGRQRELWSLLAEVNAKRPFGWDTWFGTDELHEVQKRAATKGFERLAVELEHVALLEPVLAASRRLFMFLLHRDGASLDTLAKDVADTWGSRLAHLQPDHLASTKAKLIEATNTEAAERVLRIAACLRAGDYADAIRATIDQNVAVMKTRGGLPWASLEAGKLKVRLRDESVGLPGVEELPSLWTNSYFFDSLKSIGATVFQEVA